MEQFYTPSNLRMAGVGDASQHLQPGSHLSEWILSSLLPAERVAHVSIGTGMMSFVFVVTNQRLLRFSKKSLKRPLGLSDQVTQESVERIESVSINKSKDVVIKVKNENMPWIISNEGAETRERITALVTFLIKSPPPAPRGRFFITVSASGISLNTQVPVFLEVHESGIVIHSTATMDSPYEVNFAELDEVVVSGPGLQVESSGGGMIGGGFGLVGFAVGAVAASAYNRLTENTSVSITTFLTVVGRGFQIKLLTHEIGIETLEDELAPVRIGMREAKRATETRRDDIVSKLESLVQLRDSGVLSDEDFERAKQVLLANT